MLDSTRLIWILLGSIFLLVITGSVLMVLLSDKRERNREQRAAADKRQLKHEMTGNISHELKTPVSSIMGYLETLINHPELPEEKRRLFLERSYIQTRRLSAMITDISTITKLEEVPGQFRIEPVNIKLIFNEVAEEFTSQIAENRISVLNELPPICVRANYSLIYAIFRNLVEDTIKYAGDCCNIYIRYEDGGHGVHIFDYHDTGKGIPESELDRIFERFYRIGTDRGSDKGGSGLGLSIVRNAVAFHQGSIYAYNVEGGGLGFHFSLKDQTLSAPTSATRNRL